MSESTTTGTGKRDTKQVAREQGQQVKGSAQNAAANVAGTAGDRARDIKEQAGTHVRGIAGEAGRQLRGRVEQETKHASGALNQAGAQLQALAEGRVDDAGVFGEYAQQAAQTVNRWAESIEDRGLDGLLDDLRSVARRRPGAFLLGAVAAGVIAGRFGRNLREETSNGSDDHEPQALAAGRSFAADDRTAEVDIVDVQDRSTGLQQPPTTPPPAATTQGQSSSASDDPSAAAPPDQPRGDAVGGVQDNPLRDDIRGEHRPTDDDVDFEPADIHGRRLP